jgi:hypothetical protein
VCLHVSTKPAFLEQEFNMNHIVSVAAALGLLAAPALPVSTASACGPQKVCNRPVAPRGPSHHPGSQIPGVQGHDDHNDGGNGPNQQGNNNNQNGNNQNGNNQNAQNQNQNGNQNQNQNQTQQNQNTTQTQNQQQTQTVSIPAGSRITLPGNYGSQMGAVYLVINGIKLPMVVEQWNESGITLTLPVMQLTAAQQVKLEIVKADNTQLASMDVTLNPTPKVIVLDQPTVVPSQTADVAPDAPTNG